MTTAALAAEAHASASSSPAARTIYRRYDHWWADLPAARPSYTRPHDTGRSPGRVVHCLDRPRVRLQDQGLVRALDRRATPADELASRRRRHLTDLEGIGDSSATVIQQALAGGAVALPHRAGGQDPVPLTDAGAVARR